MKMCEYANNVFDMFLLFYMQDKNRKIVYEGEKYYPSLLTVSQYSTFNIIYMVFPRMYRSRGFILLLKANNVIFEKVNKIDLGIGILYESW